MSGNEWFAGLTVDHLYADCPNRTKAEASLRESGLWDSGNEGGIDPLGDLVCGMCQHRYLRSVAATGVAE